MAFSTIQGSGSAPDSFVGTSGVDSISLASVPKPFILEAFEADDTVTFTAVDNQNSNVSNSFLKLGEGNDVVVDAADYGTNFSATFLNGNAGVDNFSLRGVFASSTLQGGQGDDLIEFGFLGTGTPNPGIASSLVNGNLGADSMAFSTVISNSTIRGGQGDDDIFFSNSVINSFVTGDLGNDQITITSFNPVTGAPAINTYVGTTFAGGEGNDTITAQAVGVTATGAGIIAIGEGGNDTITGSFEADTIDGGIGDDMLDGDFGDDILNGGEGVDTINGGFGADTIDGGLGSDVIRGGEGADAIDGGLGNDLIFGDAGNDTINGGDGADTIRGGIGFDVIDGGLLDDIIIGDSEADILSGGTGNNRFVQRDGSTGIVTFQNVNTTGIGLLNRQIYNDNDTFTIGNGGADVITDWGTGAINALDTGLAGDAVNADGRTIDYTGILPPAVAAEGNLWFRGDYDGKGVFRLNNTTGADIGIVTSATPGKYSSNFTVLQGAGGSVLEDADFIVVNPLPV